MSAAVEEAEGALGGAPSQVGAPIGLAKPTSSLDDSTAAQSPTGPDPSVPLRRNVRFQLLWTGSACAFIGMAGADVAFPLVILAMTHSPARAGAFATVQMLAMLFVSIPAGGLLDRVDRRRLLLSAEGARVLAMTSVAVTWYLHALTFWQLIATSILLGAVSPFGAARMLLVRAVVPPSQLTAAVTQEQVRDHSAELIGPPLGGALFGISRALPFVFSAVTFAVSFVCAFLVRVPPVEKPRAPKSEPEQNPDAIRNSDQNSEETHENEEDHEDDRETPPSEVPDAGVLAGIRTLLGTPVLRATCLTLALVNMVAIPLNLTLIVLLQRQSIGSGTIGAVLGAGAVGGLLGAPLVKPLHRALRPGWLLIGAVAVFTVTIFAAAFPHGPVYAGAMIFLASLAIPAAVVMVDVLILRQIPDEVRGRTLAAFQTIMGIGMPVGMLSAGLMLQYLSATTALISMACGLAGAGLYAVSQRALRDAQWPETSQPS